jgi:tetratricopeptide (TPR) repeat protein
MVPAPPEKRESAASALERQVWERVEQKDMQGALAACEQLNRQHPEFASGWHTASQLALKLNKPSIALKAIGKAIELEPDDTSWILQQALCLAKLGNMRALESQVDLLSTRPMKTAYQCSTLGMLLTQLGRREQALKFYERVAVLKPGDARN